MSTSACQYGECQHCSGCGRSIRLVGGTLTATKRSWALIPASKSQGFCWTASSPGTAASRIPRGGSATEYLNRFRRVVHVASEMEGRQRRHARPIETWHAADFGQAHRISSHPDLHRPSRRTGTFTF
uniref:Uncharacterized protein n=1 Tax=Aquabacterium sp. PL1F5 TaxID=503996 RepID=B4Y2Z0_9BURK|nr:hypothetical protein [Aquabacterium sp. PL1F5]